MKTKTRGMALSAAIAALYAVLTVMPGLNLLAYGSVQFRVSEVLCILPLFTPWAIPGLTVGCFLANVLSTAGTLDMLFGTIATLIAATCTYLLRNKPKVVALLPPVISNGLIIGWMITYFYTDTAGKFAQVLAYNMFTVALGEVGVCFLLGLPFAAYIEKHRNMFKL